MTNCTELTNNQLACWSDEDLLSEYRLTGNRELFEALVHRYEKELFNYLFRMTGNRQTAEDVFQATFLQVHRKCSQFETGRAFRPWLYRIASNQAIDNRRKAKRHDAVSLDETFGGSHSEGDSLASILCGNDRDPAQTVELQDTIAQLRGAISRLPEVQREVIDLVCMRGMTYREAAETLTVPVKTVATRLMAAKKRLASALGALA
ncbi:MAG: RNA polymerase sigma factor [Thermoguttaceae bacterium]|nr:RNA polymerase sigma factor [Thermoguttaceae bacterium]